MTQRIGTGASAQITTYVAQANTTARQLETSVAVGGTTLAGLTSQSPSGSTARLLSTGPVNPGRLYVQGATIKNEHATDTIYVGFDATVTSGAGFHVRPGSALELPMSNLQNVWVITGAGAANLHVVAV
jgi:hypothetical protein